MVEATYLKESHSELKKDKWLRFLEETERERPPPFVPIMGLVPVTTGFIKFSGEDITNKKPYRIAQLGVGYVPEERAVFPSLSVYENLTLPMAKGRAGLWSIDKIYSFFPILKARGFHRGSQLSGGEQQMLVIARILTMNVKLIILDEPTEGLAPMLVREIAKIVLRAKKGRDFNTFGGTKQLDLQRKSPTNIS